MFGVPETGRTRNGKQSLRSRWRGTSRITTLNEAQLSTRDFHYTERCTPSENMAGYFHQDPISTHTHTITFVHT